MRRKVTTRLRGPLERDVALAIKVRKENCPEMGTYPESFYEGIEHGIRKARGDYDLITVTEIVEDIGPPRDIDTL
jgi:hypothetical protein